MPPPHGKIHLKFPFWLFDYLPYELEAPKSIASNAGKASNASNTSDASKTSASVNRLSKYLVFEQGEVGKITWYVKVWYISIHVHIFQFVDSIPKSAAGKILKKELRDDFQRSAKARASAIV